MALVRLLLLGLFVFLVVTVAAFVYLQWWQAILVSFLTFLLLVYSAKYLIRYAVSRLSLMAADMFRIKSQVLRGATVEVHSVRPIDVPAGAIADFKETQCEGEDEDGEVEEFPDPARLRWYEVEATIFPGTGAPGPMTHWDIDDLRLVPADTPDIQSPEDLEAVVDEVDFYRVRLIDNGEEIDPDGPKVPGPQRLRFTAGFPPVSRDWKFRYYFEQFGRIRLPSSGGVI
jgi:hypothetical protein